MIKQPGLCTVCGIECFNIVERFPGDHAYGNCVRRVGNMLERGTQIEFLLSDGTIMPITMCVDCAKDLTPDKYSAIMGFVIAAWEQSMDDHHRNLIGAKPWDDKTMTKDAYRRHYYNLWIVAKLHARRFENPTDDPVLDRRV